MAQYRIYMLNHSPKVYEHSTNENTAQSAHPHYLISVCFSWIFVWISQMEVGWEHPLAVHETEPKIIPLILLHLHKMIKKTCPSSTKPFLFITSLNHSILSPLCSFSPYRNKVDLVSFGAPICSQNYCQATRPLSRLVEKPIMWFPNRSDTN